MDWSEDEITVLADSCNRIAARCYNHQLGHEFDRLASALRENPVGYEEIRVRVEACEIARRRAEAEIGVEINTEARLILFALRQMPIQGAFHPSMPGRGNLFKAIAEWAENLAFDLSSSRRALAVQFEDSIDRMSMLNRALTRSLSDYESELGSYRDWARNYVVR